MNKLIAYLQDHQLTQHEAAALFGVSQSAVAKWVTGVRSPSLKRAAHIQRVTGGCVPISAWVSLEAAEENA